jgi:hypothetical protein
MNNNDLKGFSGALMTFQSKLPYYYTYNGIFLAWALLSLIYYAVNAADANCSQRTLHPMQ